MGAAMTDHPEWNVLLRTCPSRTSLAEIANKWTALIVVVLGPGPLRFSEVRERVDGISPKVLAETLRRLQRDGLVTRTAFAEMPPRVEYGLTELGRTLREPLEALRTWAESNIEKVLAARDAFDQDATPS
jgi:DNA-binding HxlR family transcriptional regulator